MTSRIKKENHGVFSCLVTLLILLLFTRYSFNVDIPRVVLTSVVIAIAVIGTKDEILAISLCCIPLHEAIDFYIALIACAVMLIAKNPRLMKSKVFIILGLFVVFWELLHCVSIDFSFVSLIIAIVPIAFLL